MPGTVFISHAGADSQMALSVSDKLSNAGIGVRLDRHESTPGYSFVAFMEQSLADSDYCLLLWSRRAAQQAWVAVEWHAALVKAVKEQRAFIVTARLEEFPVPTLLASRLYVDLFPDLGAGVDRLLSLWHSDGAAERAAERPVASAPLAVTAGGPDEVFVTSEVFGITVPVRTSLAYPAGALLTRVVSEFGLPSSMAHEGRAGVRFDYALSFAKNVLASDVPLRDQGVAEHSILWIETTMVPFAAGTVVGGRLQSVTLRGSNPAQIGDAKRWLRDEIARNGLGAATRRDRPALLPRKMDPT